MKYLLLTLSAVVILGGCTEHGNPNTIENHIKCQEIFENIKEEVYGDDTGKITTIYSNKHDTCLSGKVDLLKNNKGFNDYEISVYDLLKRYFLLHYFELDGKPHGGDKMTREEAFERYKNFGFSW